MTQQSLTIMIGADTYPPDVNGAAQFGYRLATAMHHRGHQVHVVAANPKERKNYTRTVNGVVEHRLISHKALTHPTIRICTPWGIWKRVGEILDDVKPDVVHVQCHYIVGRVLLLQARKRGIRVVATNHFMPENLDPFLPFPRWFNDAFAQLSWKDMRFVLERAQVVTTPTPIAARAMKEAGNFKKPVIPISNGINSDDYQLREGEHFDPHPQELRIFFAGRLAVEKNIDVLIEALSLLPQELNHTVLELAGEGEKHEELQEKAQECGVADRVRFLGYVSDEQLREGYLRADVFCQPGTAELQSLVTLEAMSASRPVVLANALALPHLVQEGENGYLFEPNNAADLAQKLAQVLLAPEEERRRMGQCSRQMVEIHSAQKTWETFESLYLSNQIYYDFVVSQKK
ncbi:glycosyltransferase [Rothia sp. CCM 9419]|uniref:glycosyltransferase n=1 Tax=Rothia sp. CCM 9419 TaxID=3402662 RepID=UPI003ADA8AE1